jgi:hypothetical protein
MFLVLLGLRVLVPAVPLIFLLSLFAARRGAMFMVVTRRHLGCILVGLFELF